ncbi:MAG: hypothetical protein KME07_00850 [Pegethrix bostrychoides GSE-TBD4-15B]|jgi:hypothetical protein|uniref:Uncharacterized protein n=1 Tax=Pegethrix bostrychoides GSE-TBD4-15B TaxID=2839662 RepID=A0A951U2V0_9CYAN|nr:hypothetical protein [Pegethrix bostrychoides GSE-TBD4-15B]
MGYRLRKVVKAKPRKLLETNEIFKNITRYNEQRNNVSVKRLSVDCKAVISIGDYAKGRKEAIL